MEEAIAETQEKKTHFGVKMSDLTATREEREGKLFWEVIGLFTQWAKVDTFERGISLPNLQSMRKAIALGQTFQWRRTGTHYKLVVVRDHVTMSEKEYDRSEYCVFFFADVNFAMTAETAKAYQTARDAAKEFDVLVEEFLVEKGVAEELRAYDFRRRK
jgi:hypothetical protein